MQQDLIYDVGLHDGEDTAYYLSKGYRVVAIEADPTLAEKARVRFAKEVEEGRLRVLNIAIGPEEGVLPFWICERHREWNSFFEEVASRLGEKHYAIEVQCRRFRDVLGEHGVPYYLKVDIEGYDHYCIEDIDPKGPPQYVSLELSRFEDLITLHHRGYDAFKIINQLDHSQFLFDPACPFKQWLKLRLKRRPRIYNLCDRLATMKGAVVRLLPRRRRRVKGRPQESPDGGQVPPGQSGPFGEETAGEWTTFEQACYFVLGWMYGHSQYGEPSQAVWFDVHATKQADAPLALPPPGGPD
jgi:FkbM family methyltransferase